MTIYYQLENMLVAGFKSEEELQRYQGLKAEYEEETLDYSFSIREIVNQLEIIIQSRENDFPNLEEGLLQDYQELVEYLREYDVSQAEKYTSRIYRGLALSNSSEKILYHKIAESNAKLPYQLYRFKEFF